MLNKKIVKKIDKITDILGHAMIFTVLIVLIAEFIVIGIFGFKIFYANAQTAPNLKAVNPANVPEIAIPVGNFNSSASFDAQHPENWIGQYVQAWFNYLVGAIGIIAVVMVMWGGIKWITSGGNSGQIEEAKTKIKNAVIGIVLLLGAYTIFTTINPQLLNLSLPPITQVVDTVAECQWKKECEVTEYKTSEPEIDCKNIIPIGIDKNSVICCCKLNMIVLDYNEPIDTEEKFQKVATDCKEKTNCTKKVNIEPIEPEKYNMTKWGCKCEESLGDETASVEEARIRAELESAGISFNHKNACLPGQTKGCTTIAGIKPETVDVMINLVKEVGRGNVEITGCTEDGHSSKHTLGVGVDAHYAGNDDDKVPTKADPIGKYVLANQTKESHERSDGTVVYTVGDVEYAFEFKTAQRDVHWDICVGCASG